MISSRVAQFIIQNSRPKLDHFFSIIHVECYFKSHKTQVSGISLNGINKQIIVISGSLRKASFTTAVCRVLVKEMNETQKASADNKIEFVLRDYVRELPLYDGDQDISPDTETPPAVVVDFRRELSEAHAIIIGTPEYNYNVPGGLKNVIDWASRPFAKHCLMGRRIGVFGCAPGERGGKSAVEYLRNIVPLLGATLVGPELLFPKINSLISPDGALDASVLSPLTELAKELAN
ncbi:MAG: NADPH-dependent FMN reductase [Acidimicrobiaceae bacterium]